MSIFTLWDNEKKRSESSDSKMQVWDGNEGTGGLSLSSDSRRALMLEFNNVMDDQNRKEDCILGNLIIAPTRYLFDYQPHRDAGMPLALCSRYFDSPDQVVFDIFGSHCHFQDTMTITNITGLFEKTFLYSKDGWLLFSRPDPTNLRAKGFFLHNIVTGEYTDLPDVIGAFGRNYAFSTSSSSSRSSTVEYVVNVKRDSPTSRLTTIYVTTPNAGTWEVYTKNNGPDHYYFVAVIIFRKSVYMFDGSERIEVFDLVERRWWSITGVERYMPFVHFTELDGKIVKIFAPERDLNLYKFFRLEWDDDKYTVSWVEMSESELENKSWFLGGLRSRSFCVKHRQRSGEADVYRFTSHRSGHQSFLNIQVYNLKAGTAHNVLPFPMFSTSDRGWIDMGCSSDTRP